MTVLHNVVVGSNNPAKIESVRQAFCGVWPTTHWDVQGISTNSGVAEQPLDELETLTGARNRAQVAWSVAGSWYSTKMVLRVWLRRPGFPSQIIFTSKCSQVCPSEISVIRSSVRLI